MKAKEVEQIVRVLVKCEFIPGEAKEEAFKGGGQGSQDGNWQWRSCKGIEEMISSKLFHKCLKEKYVYIMGIWGERKIWRALRICLPG